MKRIFLIVTSILLLLCLCCCSSSFSSIGDLVRPPKLYGEYSSLQEALEKVEKGKIGTDINMQYIKSGDYKHTSYVFFDLDGNGTEEALIFYSLKSDKEVVIMRPFYNSEGSWIPLDSVVGSGSSVFSVEFADIDDDGYYGIVITWEIYESTSKMLSVYSISVQENQLSLKSIANESCNTVTCVDIDNDGITDILTTNTDLSYSHVKAFARILKVDDNGAIYLFGETEIDATVLAYTSIQVEPASKNKPVKIFLDATKGENQMITEVLYWDSATKLLTSLFFDSDIFMTTRTLRSVRIKSSDIDNDGFIEIPMPSNSMNNPNIVAWKKINENNSLTHVKYSAVSNDLAYMVDCPSSWIDTVNVTYDSELQKMTFYNSVNQLKESLGSELFSIIAYNSASSSSSIPQDYILLAKNPKSGIEYYFSITDIGADFGITKESIKISIL